MGAFYQFYVFYRNIGIDGIVVFGFLSATLYLLCGIKRQNITLRRYVILSTLSYLVCYSVALPWQKMPSTSALSGPSIPYWYYFLCTFGAALLWAHLVLKSTFLSKLTYSLFFVAFVNLFKMVCAPLYRQESVMEPVVYALWDIGTAMILYLCLYGLTVVFRRFSINGTVKVFPRGTLVLLYLPSSFLVGLVLCNTLGFEQYDGQIMSAILLTNLPLLYYGMAMFVQAYDEQRGMDAILAQTQAELENMRRSAEHQERFRRERHELKNNYFYIQTLLRQGEYEKLDTYLEHITGEVLTPLSTIETGDPLIDTLLNNKIDYARSQNIKTCAEVVVPKELSLETEHLFTILSNLLDNAIEASMEETERDLQLSMKCVQGYWVCQVRNKVSHDVLAENPSLRTTKGNAPEHGFGIKIVRSTVQACNGMFEVAVEDGYFAAKVMLPLEQL